MIRFRGGRASNNEGWWEFWTPTIWEADEFLTGLQWVAGHELVSNPYEQCGKVHTVPGVAETSGRE